MIACLYTSSFGAVSHSLLDAFSCADKLPSLLTVSLHVNFLMTLWFPRCFVQFARLYVIASSIYIHSHSFLCTFSVLAKHITAQSSPHKYSITVLLHINCYILCCGVCDYLILPLRLQVTGYWVPSLALRDAEVFSCWEGIPGLLSWYQVVG